MTYITWCNTNYNTIYYGSCFTSDELQTFLLSNGIKHWRSSPYHPSSNGLAEKATEIVKQGLKRMMDGTSSYNLSQLPSATKHSSQCNWSITSAI